ncbi:hypothetical protein JL722_3989 [Aureococcus anophagefferens]|nr:hypothetical protein JL722_3989 [Aureococcus anophagefferens]
MDASWFWVPDDAEGFVAARLVSRNKRDNLVCVSRDGRTLDPAPASACYAIDDVASVDEPPPCDLVLLAEVSPASILHALRRRFEDDDIYTSLGSVLVALNPFKAIDGLYGPAALAHYGGGAGGALAPHVYDVAAAAYRGVRGGDAGSARSQSLVISGESGAGKTETTKHALAYLAFVAGSPGGVQERILAASPILEALGNAKTSRNDNSSRLCGSSRFGKFMELRFDASGAIASCGNTPYLLESGRVVGQAPGERNFHAPSASTRERDGLLKIVAAVLHLGDASFRDSDGPEDGSAADAPGRDALERAAACLGADAAALERALTLRTVEVKTGRRCSVTKVPLPPPQAAVARDAFARQRYAVPETTGGTPRPAKTSRARLYGALFEWTVGRVNESVGGGGAASSGPVVGVLDIFGFEIFTVNSFEQLLINFANEGLQRLFNRTVFDEEMALYEAEGVGQCVRLDYVDNADVLALLGGRRPPGVVEMLDEESKLPRGSSANFRARLAKRHAGHARFSTPRSASTAFFVEHYAGKVCYEAASFVEKNRDGVTGDMVAAFGDCTLPLVAACFAGRGAASKASVGAKFKKSLDALTATLGATEPHYVRCVKSNPRKAPGTMDYKLCLEQLTYAGVLEAVKIHQRGFPFRLDHVAFRRSYHAAVGLLADRAGAADRSKLFAGPPRAQCEALAAALAARDDAWPSGDLVVGRTRVLYRSGVHRRLEKRREAALGLARATVVRALAAATTKRISDTLRAAVRALADAMVAWDGGCVAATCDDLDRACASASRGRAAFFGLFLRASYVPAARRMLDFLARRAALDKELGGLLRGELGGDADFQTLVARCGAIEAGVAEAEGLRFRAVALGRVVQGAGPGDSENYGRAVAARDAVARVADVKRSLDLGLRDRDEDRLTAALGALDELRSDGKLAAGLWADDEARARRAAAEIVEQQRALVAEFQSAFASGDGAALASAVKSADEATRTRALSKTTRDARAAARTLLELRDFDARGAWDDAARLAGDDGAWAVGAWAAAVEGERASRARATARSSTSSTSRASRPRSRTRRARSPPPRDEVAAATVEAHYRAARKALALAPMDGRPDAVAAFDPNAGLDGDEWVDSDVFAHVTAKPLNDALAACDDRERKCAAAGADVSGDGALLELKDLCALLADARRAVAGDDDARAPPSSARSRRRRRRRGRRAARVRRRVPRARRLAAGSARRAARAAAVAASAGRVRGSVGDVDASAADGGPAADAGAVPGCGTAAARARAPLAPRRARARVRRGRPRRRAVPRRPRRRPSAPRAGPSRARRGATARAALAETAGELALVAECAERRSECLRSAMARGGFVAGAGPASVDLGPLKDALRAAGAFEADHGALSPSARHLADDAARLLELRAAIRESRWEADPRCPWRGGAQGRHPPRRARRPRRARGTGCDLRYGVGSLPFDPVVQLRFSPPGVDVRSILDPEDDVIDEDDLGKCFVRLELDFEVDDNGVSKGSDATVVPALMRLREDQKRQPFFS